MNRQLIKSESSLYYKLKLLMLIRLVFTTLLLGATIFLQIEKNSSLVDKPLLFLYGLTGGIFLLAFCYTLILYHVKRELLFAYWQIIFDTFIVTLIVYITGCYSSSFVFFYLVVIIYSSMLLFRRGSMIMAAMCSIQYGVMIDLEYYGILKPFIIEETLLSTNHDWNHVLYKIVFTMGACFAVAYLSSILSEQAKNTKNQLVAMEDHVKRVEKMAAVGEMAAGLAHELKNPLASLTGSIQLLREDTQFNSYHDKLIQIFLREAGRLNDLVNNFLMYAKPPFRGQAKATEVRKELTDTIRLFEKDNLCKERIKIINNLNEDIWTEIDPLHLRQILLNLLLNAAESIEDTGMIKIKISNTSGHNAALEIFDTGCGMTDDTIQSIFDPFFTTKQKGTGLGLSIVHNILEAYGNRIDVKSTINKGTTFIVHFKKIDSPLLQMEYSKVYTDLPSLAHG